MDIENRAVDHRGAAAGRRDSELATQQWMGLSPQLNARAGVGSPWALRCLWDDYDVSDQVRRTGK